MAERKAAAGPDKVGVNRYTTNSGGGFGTEDALEPRAGELDADEFFAVRRRIGDMHYAALGGEVGFFVSCTCKTIVISGARKAAGVSCACEALCVSGIPDSTRGVVRKRDANFEVGADGYVEAGYEGGAVAAKIFAGSFFFEEDAAFIASADFERQVDGDSTFRTLPRYGRAHRDHGLGPLFL